MKFDDKNFIAQQVRMHRKKLGLTQEELAEMVNLSEQHISRIESGCYTPSLKSFFMLATALKIDLRIFGYDTEQNANLLKESLIQKIVNATDAEVIFYQNVMAAISGSLAKVKQELL